MSQPHPDPSHSEPSGNIPPLENSWWVFPDRFLAGPFPGSPDSRKSQEQMRALAEAGIDAVINLQEEHETNATGQYFPAYQPHLLKFQPNLLYLRVPIRDMGIPNDLTLHWLVLTIERLLSEGRRLYLHCWGGHGRSGTVAGACLIQAGIEAKLVLRELAVRRQHNAHLRQFDCPQTAEQKRLLRKWRQQ